MVPFPQFSPGSSFETVVIVIHNYRWRLGLAEGERKYDDLERRLAAGPVITLPTITLEGDANGAPHPGSTPAILRYKDKKQLLEGNQFPTPT
jgi:hypothetical protein